MSNVFKKSIIHIAPVISEIVSNGGSVKLEVKGNSMMPLIRDEKDTVLLKKADDVKKYDVVLFRKKDGNIALHRIVESNDSQYTIIGDNQYRFDCNIKHDDLIAKVSQLDRGKHSIKEEQIRWFGMVWYATYPLRNFTKRGFRWIKRHFFACIRCLKNKFR